MTGIRKQKRRNNGELRPMPGDGNFVEKNIAVLSFNAETILSFENGRASVKTSQVGKKRG